MPDADGEAENDAETVAVAEKLAHAVEDGEIVNDTLGVDEAELTTVAVVVVVCEAEMHADALGVGVELSPATSDALATSDREETAESVAAALGDDETLPVRDEGAEAEAKADSVALEDGVRAATVADEAALGDGVPERDWLGEAEFDGEAVAEAAGEKLVDPVPHAESVGETVSEPDERTDADGGADAEALGVKEGEPELLRVLSTDTLAVVDVVTDAESEGVVVEQTVALCRGDGVVDAVFDAVAVTVTVVVEVGVTVGDARALPDARDPVAAAVADGHTDTDADTDGVTVPLSDAVALAAPDADTANERVSVFVTVLHGLGE